LKYYFASCNYTYDKTYGFKNGYIAMHGYNFNLKEATGLIKEATGADEVVIINYVEVDKETYEANSNVG